jgi:hypothetical protein
MVTHEAKPFTLRYKGDVVTCGTLVEGANRVQEACRGIAAVVGNYRQEHKARRLEIGRMLIDLHAAYRWERGSSHAWQKWIHQFMPGVKERSIQLWMQTAARADATLDPVEIDESPSLRQIQLKVGSRSGVGSAHNGAHFDAAGVNDADPAELSSAVDSSDEEFGSESEFESRWLDAQGEVLAEREALGLEPLSPADEDAAVRARLGLTPPLASAAQAGPALAEGWAERAVPRATTPSSLPTPAGAYLAGRGSVAPSPRADVAGQMTFADLRRGVAREVRDIATRIESCRTPEELASLIDALHSFRPSAEAAG